MSKNNKELQEALEQSRWAEAGAILNDLVSKSEYSDLDSIDFSSAESPRIWAEALIKTGLYRMSAQGRYLFLRYIHWLWDRSNVLERWDLMRCIMPICGIYIDDFSSEQSIISFVVNISKTIGVSQDEVCEVIIKQCQALGSMKTQGVVKIQ